MIGLADVRDYISTLNLTNDGNIYCGKLDNKKQKSIGIYKLNQTNNARICLGGLECTPYRIKPISILIHWNKSIRETEKVAMQLYDILQSSRDIKINNVNVSYVKMLVDEPQDVGTDDSGIYEQVIQIELYYER
jgi:hypothetical protein